MCFLLTDRTLWPNSILNRIRISRKQNTPPIKCGDANTFTTEQENYFFSDKKVQIKVKKN